MKDNAKPTTQLLHCIDQNGRHTTIIDPLKKIEHIYKCSANKTVICFGRGGSEYDREIYVMCEYEKFVQIMNNFAFNNFNQQSTEQKLQS